MTEKVNNKRSFLNGWMQLRAIDQPLARKLIMEGLKVQSNWYSLLNGKRKRIDIEEMETIELVFAKFGVVDNIWGNDLCVSNETSLS